MTEQLKKLNIFLFKYCLEIVLVFLLVAMTLTVFSQVIARYIFEAPLSWSEELARFILIWLSMLSAAYAFKTKSHFALTILVNKLPEKHQKITSFCVNMLVAIFFLIICYYSVIFVHSVNGHVAPALQISMQIPYSSVIVASGLITIFSLLSAVKTMSKKIQSAEK
jgi:TRAP-type C4-dicarboxylate transport system permease small subunit